ncbi:hypothetical protein BDZ45DRAFT_669285 [Acephala macrosclerotiorum]|nr:hypothetical protein BDZ45DRAFT_669285 [Acephala macrosclerotiorum]
MPCGRCGRARDEAKKPCNNCFYKGYTIEPSAKNCQDCGGRGTHPRDPSRNCSSCRGYGKELSYCYQCAGSTNNEVCTQNYHSGATE